MDYEKLKEVIAKQIKENGRGEITGPVLQAVLMAMVDSLGEVYSHTYTDEEKAQARANIDALSNHNGEITKEKLSAEVQAILNDVANKQNITDESLATTSKEVVGAINELFNGGVKDKSIEVGKLAQAVQDTIGKVGASVKVLSSGTDLKAVEETGVYILSGLKDYLNYPNKWEHYNTSILIVSGDGNNYNKGKTIIGFQNGSQYPFAATLRNNEWIETDLDTALASYVAKSDIVDTTGSATDKVMSQQGVTEAINGVTNKVTELSEKVDGKQDNIDSLSTDEKNALLVSLGLGKIGVVSQKQTWNDVGVEPAYIMSEKVKGFISQDDIDILTSYGFVFNEETGYFELNGLTDISLQEALDIVSVGKPNFSLCDLHYAYKKIRTNLPIFDNRNYNAAYFGNGISNKIRMGAMAYQSDIEVFVYGQYKINDNYVVSGFLYSEIEQGGKAFNYCSKLEKISIIPGTSKRFYETFIGCFRLKELELVYLMCDVNLRDSSLLSAKSIHIMISNAKNNNAITITLHSDAKTRWEASEYYAEDSQTIVTKNITIA